MTMTNPNNAAPVASSERIQSLDLLRGFAVLGILLMNIQDFSMISAAYFNPTAYGDLNGVNWYVWLFKHLFADMKFMTLFTILFGAGIILFSDRVASKNRRLGGFHYRRTLWLIVFGLAHAYLIWRGDILFGYGVCALFVFLFRKRTPKTLFIVGMTILLIGTAIYLFFGWSVPYWPAEQLATMENNLWQPNAEKVAAEIAAYKGGFIQQMTMRIPNALAIQTSAFFSFLMWRISGLMFIGMALYKWGVLSAQRSNAFYSRLLIIGFGAGLATIAFGVHENMVNNWQLAYSFFYGVLYNYWGSLFVAGAYIGAIMLLAKKVGHSPMLKPLDATGRMAFTNYIMQSLIATFIFYGHGFGYFGAVERWGQLLIVIGIWLFQIVFSVIWLKRFRYGPLEWLWRSLTYWKIQPMKSN
jgi:uncharacterized protein